MLKKCICKSDIGPIINPHTQLLVNERLEICSLLLDQLNSVFTSPITNMIVHDPASFFSCQSINPDECLTDIEITEQIIIDYIHEVSSTSAAGPDGVPSSLLLLLLLYAFRYLWKEWGDCNFQIFSQNCQFHHRRLESFYI